MVKKDATAESKPKTNAQEKKEEMSPELKKEINKLTREYNAKLNENADRPTFPTRLSSKMQGGTTVMCVTMVIYLAAIAYLFQQGTCFMMNKNAKFGSDKVSQYFAANHFLMVLFVLITNLKVPMNISNIAFLGLSIGLNAFAFMNNAEIFNDLGFYGLVAIQVLMLVLTLAGYYRTTSLINAILFFTALTMFSTMWGQPLMAAKLTQLQREFVGWTFCGLFYFSATNMGLQTTIANFVVLIFWVGIDLVVVEDNKSWKTEQHWQSSLWILGFHGVNAAIHQMSMFLEAGAANKAKMDMRMEYMNNVRELKLKMSAKKSKDL